MSKPLESIENPDRRAVEGRFMSLFSSQNLSIQDAISQFESLESSPSIYSFMTPLSWAIQRSDGNKISGNDLSLLDAVKSILGALQLLPSNPENNGEQISFAVGKSRIAVRDSATTSMSRP